MQYFILGQVPARGESHSQEVIRLIELLTNDDDPLTLERARWLLMVGKSPSDALKSLDHVPAHVPDAFDIPRIQSAALFDLGRYLMTHRAEFPNGLPVLSGNLNPLRLSALVDGMSRLNGVSRRDGDLVLSEMINDSWLTAAEKSGQTAFSSRVRIARGQLLEMLAQTENSGDELGTMCLGIAAQEYPEALDQINPVNFKVRTLALLMAGIFSNPPPRGTNPRFRETCQMWCDIHPDLFDEVGFMLADPASFRLQEIKDRWSRGDRFGAWDVLFPICPEEAWWKPWYAKQLLVESELGVEEIARLCRSMPRQTLFECVRIPASSHLSKGEEQVNRIMQQVLKASNEGTIHSGGK